MLRIRWLEKESRGFTDEIPEWMLADEGHWKRVSHNCKGPRGGDYRALCDLSSRGKVVELDYRPYDINRKEFYLGILRLTFKDAGRRGEPKVAWKDEKSRRFETIEAEVTFSQTDTSPDSISEVEICAASEEFDPLNLADARCHIVASLALRKGQQKFRSDLKSAYQNKCALTGCAVVEVLEAAHIIGFRGDHTNHVQNGLLLRADVHTLFDMGLVGIDPDTWKVVLHPTLRLGDYGKLHGSTPHLPTAKGKRPNAEALRWHVKRHKLGA